MDLDTALWLRGLVSDPDASDDQRAAARDTLAELERLRTIAAAAEALLAELDDSASVELGDMISADTLERFRGAVRDRG